MVSHNFHKALRSFQLMEQGVKLVQAQLCVNVFLLIVFVQNVEFQTDAALAVWLYHRVSRRNYNHMSEFKELTLELVVKVDKLAHMHLFEEIHHLLLLLATRCVGNSLDTLFQRLGNAKLFQLFCLFFRWHRFNWVDKDYAVRKSWCEELCCDALCFVLWAESL